MIDNSSLLKSQGSLYLEFISKDGLFHKMLLLSLMGFLTGWCNPQMIRLVQTKFQNLTEFVINSNQGVPAQNPTRGNSYPVLGGVYISYPLIPKSNATKKPTNIQLV